MRMTLKLSVVGLLLAVLVLSSCELDELDFSKVVVPELGVGVKAPAAKADYLLSDFIEGIDDGDGLITVDEDGLYHISYQEEDFFNYNAMDLVDVPEQIMSSSLNIGISKVLGNAYPGPIPSGGIFIQINEHQPYMENIQHEIDFGNTGTEEDVFLSELVLDECEFDVQMTSSLTTSVVTTVTLTNCFKDNQPVQVELTSANPTKIVSLDGATVIFNTNDGENTITYTTSVSIPDNPNAFVAADQAIDISFELGSATAYSVKGYFGKKTIDIEPGLLSFGGDLFNQLGKDLEFANPTMNLIIQNSILAPALINFDLESRKLAESTVKLNAEAIDLVLPASAEEMAEREYVLNKNNSNLINLIASLPSDELIYTGTVDVNPSSIVRNNVITKKSTISMDMAIDLPLELKTEGFSLKDTIEFGGIDGGIELEKTLVKIRAENLIPMSIASEIVFVDSISNQMMSKVIQLADFAPAKTDDQGNEIEATSTEVEIALTADELEQLKDANRVLFNATLTSPKQGQGVGRLKATQSLNLEIKIESRITL